MTKKIETIRIDYSDGTCAQIDRYALEQLEALQGMVDLLDRAKSVWNTLDMIFKGKQV